MQSWILKEFQVGVLNDLKEKKSLGIDAKEVIEFLFLLLESCRNKRMRLFLLILIAIETKEANQSDRHIQNQEVVI